MTNRFPVHTTPEKFKNGGVILKMHQKLSVHTTHEEFKNAAINSRIACLFEKTQAEKYHDYLNVVVSKKPVFKLFSVWFKRRILHAPNRVAGLSACKMRRLNQLNATYFNSMRVIRIFDMH